MKFNELLSQLKTNGTKHILVTGPQRSGTTIATYILAKELEGRFCWERFIGTRDFPRFIKLTESMKEDTYVVQGPAICHKLLEVPEDIAIVFMKRDTNDIIASEKRVGWRRPDGTGQNIGERKRFIEWEDQLDMTQEVSDVKCEYLEKIVKPVIKNDLYELDYESMASHPLWIDKDARKDFKSHQLAPSINLVR